MQKQNYMNRSNLEYIEDLYQQFLQDPSQIDGDWKLFFEGVEFSKSMASSSGQGTLSEKEFDVSQLIKAYRDYGHLKADLDPLKLQKPLNDFFELKKFNLQPSDLELNFSIANSMYLKSTQLKDIIAHLENSYCKTLTAQLSECRAEVRDWFRAEFEQNAGKFQLNDEDRKTIFQQLARTESLEKFIHTRYVGTKRFSIEGGDALIPMLEHMTIKGTAQGLEEIVIGMAHRGRINVLANFMGKGLEIIFSEFDGTAFNDMENDGDVKYHLGYSADKETPNGPCHVSLAFNPSHLEAVNPVVLGMTRAKQRQRNDTKNRKKVVPVVIHGDAAFAGQGVVSESLQLSRLKGYTVGGSIHIILNNQVGFTTNPEDARSTMYSSDMAMSIKAPVLLVNGDDVEACIHAIDIAFRFRQQFGEDVVIDLICYRRFGHNEGDEPAFTQPKMYEVIKKHPTLMAIYQDHLTQRSILSKQEAQSFYQEKIDNL
ncbi:MAG: 2-oxoglutarate dehydrogenase subunit E1, partial [Bdellovibrionales bacterium]|nr:2-oxoglutarate dehydrogenase subunit E1 [Bdellovibrionales bacterium]